MLGSVLVQVELRGGFKGILVVEWGAEVLVLWVDLGTKMEVVLLGGSALVWVKKKRRKKAEFCKGSEGVGCSLLWVLSLFLWTTKRQ